MSGANRRPGHIPGEAGLWVVIFGDMVIFGLFFVTFMVYRALDQTHYAASQSVLSRSTGTIYTLLLLTSSWLVALAVQLRKGGDRHTPTWALAGAITCGLAFVSLKVVDYSEKVAHGFGLDTNEFFTFYYMLTGIHLLHVLIGLVVLVVMIFVVRKPGFAHRETLILEGGGMFWHLVDILWIMLFALFYLI